MSNRSLSAPVYKTIVDEAAEGCLALSRNMKLSLRTLALVAASLATLPAFAQSSGLTLDEALTLAKTRNGDVRAAFLNAQAARSNLVVSKSAFLPTLTPSFEHSVGQSEFYTGAQKGRNDFNTTSALLDLGWRVLDSGARQNALKRAEFSLRASERTATQTLRQVLFTVHNRYYDALRATELLTVQSATLERAKVIRDQTEFRANPPIEDVPRKDVLQANADFQNARVGVLAAQSRVATALADFKAIVGWEDRETPSLAQPEPVQLPELNYSLEDAIARGLQQRPDLAAAQDRIEGQRIAVQDARLDSSVQYSLDASYRRAFAEDPFQRAALTFSASLPVYDGNRSKELVKFEQLTLESLRENFVQDQRAAISEIESAYRLYAQNRERFAAAQIALEAAELNFKAATDAQREGAGNVIEVLTAQVSLTTAASNLVEATYDMLIADAQLRLATGDPLPGEETR